MTVIRTEVFPLDDQALVIRARAGDLEAYNLLVARHTASAYRTAVLLGAGSDSEDVIQEAFVKAYRKLSRFRGDASFRSWLLTIVANETRNLHRSRAGGTGSSCGRRQRTRRPRSSRTTRSARSSPESAGRRWCRRCGNCRYGTAR